MQELTLETLFLPKSNWCLERTSQAAIDRC